MSSSDRSSPVLSPAEWEVMKVIWDDGPLAARDVCARLPVPRRWSSRTVKTLLSRLVAKQALAYDQVGNSYLYRAAVDREQLTRREARSVFRRLISNASAPILAHFIDEAELTEADIRELKRRLDKKRKGRTRPRRDSS